MRIPGILCGIAISVSLLFMTFFSVVWFAAKIYRVEFNGLNIVCFDSFSRNLKANF
jgi:hypothetical protein